MYLQKKNPVQNKNCYCLNVLGIVGTQNYKTNFIEKKGQRKKLLIGKRLRIYNIIYKRKNDNHLFVITEKIFYDKLSTVCKIITSKITKKITKHLENNNIFIEQTERFL